MRKFIYTYKLLFVSLLFLITTACHDLERPRCLPTFNNQTNIKTTENIELRGVPQNLIDNYHILQPLIDSTYIRTKLCTDLNNDEKIYISFVENMEPINQCLGTRLEAKAAFKYGYDEPYEIFIEYEWAYTGQLYAHEFIHILLVEQHRYTESENHLPLNIWQCQFIE